MIGGTGDLLKRADPWLSPVAGAGAGALRPRRRHTTEQLLVVRPGGMGDLILAQLAAEQLGIDDARWVVEARSAGWARYIGLDFVQYDDRPLGTLRTIGARHRNVVNTEQLFGLAMAFSRWGLARRGHLTAFATNRAVRRSDQQVAYDWDRAHEADEFGRLLAAATHRTWGGVVPPGRRKVSDGAAVVALGGTHHPSRHLTPEDWASFIDTVAPGRDLVLTAGPLEQDLADRLMVLLAGRATVFTGGFAGFVDRIATADRLVAVDGGPVHIASYFGVPVDALFTSGRSSKWAPLAEGSVVHRRADLSCQPCTVFGQVPPCPFDYRCRAGVPGTLTAFPIGGLSDR